MKRKTLVTTHVAAAIIAIVTIITFFISSLVADLRGNDAFIRTVKERILFTLPVLLLAMPALRVTGDKLAGKSQSSLVKVKRRRMKFILINGIALIVLAIYLYYRSHYIGIDTAFMIAQLAEFGLGIANLILISLNVKSGLQLSGRMKVV